MSDLTDLNGNSLHGKTVITLEYQHESGKLAIGGDTSNLDRTLNMLAQAERWLKAQYQMQQAMLAQAQARQEAEMARQLLVRPS